MGVNHNQTKAQPHIIGNGDGEDGKKASNNWVPVLEQPVHKPRKLKVVCIGAGYSGLMLAYKYKYEMCMDGFIDLTIYEKNSDVGGTWLENRYPGVACDVPAHIYTFLFEPNPDWSSFYASGPEIWEYIKRTTEKYKLDEPIQFNSKVVSSIWDDEAGKWRIMVRKLETNTIIEDEAHILINASGFLNKWSWPRIKGIESFKGKLLHSAAWDTNLDWTGKRVALIGNGSSGIQILPQMQPKAGHIVNYIRNPNWISSNFAAEFTPEGKNFFFSEEEKRKPRDYPEELFKMRKTIESSFNKFFYALLNDSPQQAAAYKLFKKQMQDRLNHDPEWDGYLEALQTPNVSVEFDGIQEITETGIRTTQGSHKEFDIIVCATGFDVNFCPSWEMCGRDDINLADQWREYPEAYFGVCAPNIPNYFIINGPNSPVAHGSLLAVMDWTAEYILKWCRKIATEDIKSVEVKADATDDYNVYSQEFLKRTTWSGGCRSWFKNGKSDGRVTAMYAGSVLHYKEILESFRTEDFHFEYNSPNRFRFMGNGLTIREENGEDLAFYVKN